MGKLAWDVSDIEPGGGGQVIPKGIYKVKVKSVKDRRPDKDDMQVILVVTHGKYKGAEIATWINFGESSRWKLAEFLRAVGQKDKGTADVEKAFTNKALAVNNDPREWDGEMRNSAKSFINLKAMEEAAVDDEDDEDDDDDDDDDLDAMEDDEDDDDDDDEEDEDEGTVDLSTMSRAELKAHIKGNDLDIKVTKSMSDDDIREAINDADSDEDDDEDEDEEPEDYTTWDEDELREELESRGLSTKGSKKAMITRLEKDNGSTKPF